MRAAFYGRQSTGDRLQNPLSPDDQLAYCRERASRLGCEIDEGHIYIDRGISGSDEHRPAYGRLMAGAKAKAFDAIIVESQDRLWRNQAEMHSALKRLRF